MTDAREWKKSSRSANTTDCVEVSNLLDQLRDSKNPAGPTLTANVTALIQTVKSGQLS